MREIKPKPDGRGKDLQLYPASRLLIAGIDSSFPLALSLDKRYRKWTRPLFTFDPPVSGFLRHIT